MSIATTTIDHACAGASTVPAGDCRPFRSEDAATIAAWATSDAELRWLAPSTPPPLTSAKVLAWLATSSRAFVLVDAADAPMAYGELNPMRDRGDHLWIGHVITRPDMRRRGIALALVHRLMSIAFELLGGSLVKLIVFPDNLAAIRCYERAGFYVVANEYHAFANRAGLHRMTRMEISAEKWRRDIQGRDR